MKILIALSQIVLLALLSGCNVRSNSGNNINPTTTNTTSPRELVKIKKLQKTMKVRLVAVPFKHVRGLCNAVSIKFGLGKMPQDPLYGCSFFNHKSKQCIIISPIPTYVNGDESMDTLGHELLHCFSGTFHK